MLLQRTSATWHGHAPGLVGYNAVERPREHCKGILIDLRDISKEPSRDPACSGVFLRDFATALASLHQKPLMNVIIHRIITARIDKVMRTTLPTAATALLAASLLLLLVGCATGGGQTVEDTDPNRRKTGIRTTSTEASDIRAMADKIARGILNCKEIAEADPTNPPRILFKDIVNRTRLKNIDVRQIMNKIEGQVQEAQSAGGSKVVLLERTEAPALEDEEAKQRNGSATSSRNPDEQATEGADFLLVGEITGNWIKGIKGDEDYVLFTFRLSSVARKVRVWTGEYEYRKQGRDDSAYH